MYFSNRSLLIFGFKTSLNGRVTEKRRDGEREGGTALAGCLPSQTVARAGSALEELGQGSELGSSFPVWVAGSQGLGPSIATILGTEQEGFQLALTRTPASQLAA